MTYTTLVASKGTAGSIKRDVNDSRIDAEVVLEEAQRLLYSMLRVREMKSVASISVALGASTGALPTGFLDPIGRMRDTANNKYQQLTMDEMLSRRTYNSSLVLESGQPSFYAIYDDVLNFDLKFDAAKSLIFPHYKSLTLLSASPGTNFLTDRYPHLLRQACKVQAASFLKNWTQYDKELAVLSPLIQRANAESDLTYRGADYDTDTP